MLRVQCQQELLAQALIHIKKIEPYKRPIPILSGVLLVAKDETLTLLATNRVQGVRIQIPATVVEEGRALIPCKHFIEFVNALDALPLYQVDPLDLQQAPNPPEAEAKLTRRGEGVPIPTTPLHLTSTQRSPSGNICTNKATFSAWRDDEYPWMPPSLPQAPRLPIDATALRKALQTIWRFTSEARKPDGIYDDSILLRADGAFLSLLSSRGITVAKQVLPLAHPVEQVENWQFEATTLIALEPLLPNKGIVRLSFQAEGESSVLCIETEPSCSFYCRSTSLPLMPEFRPSSDLPRETVVQVARQEVLSALKTATALERQKGGRDEITLTEQGDALLLTSSPHMSDRGSSSVPVRILDRRGGAVSNFHLKWKHLKRLLEGLTSEVVCLQFGHADHEGKRTAYLRAESAPVDGSLFVMEVGDESEGDGASHQSSEVQKSREAQLSTAP